MIRPSEEDHHMPAPLSPDIHRRFERYVLDGLSGREASRRLLISPATGAWLAAKVRAGDTFAPAPCGRPKGWGRLGVQHAFIIDVVEQDPDITMPELRDALFESRDVLVHESSLSRLLRRLGFTYKKVTGRGQATTYGCRSCSARLDKTSPAAHARAAASAVILT